METSEPRRHELEKIIEDTRNALNQLEKNAEQNRLSDGELVGIVNRMRERAKGIWDEGIKFIPKMELRGITPNAYSDIQSSNSSSRNLSDVNVRPTQQELRLTNTVTEWVDTTLQLCKPAKSKTHPSAQQSTTPRRSCRIQKRTLKASARERRTRLQRGIQRRPAHLSSSSAAMLIQLADAQK